MLNMNKNLLYIDEILKNAELHIVAMLKFKIVLNIKSNIVENTRKILREVWMLKFTLECST